MNSEDEDDILDDPNDGNEESSEHKVVYLHLLLFVLLSGANFLILYTLQQFLPISFNTLITIGFSVEVILLLTVAYRRGN